MIATAHEVGYNEFIRRRPNGAFTRSVFSLFFSLLKDSSTESNGGVYTSRQKDQRYRQPKTG